MNKESIQSNFVGDWTHEKIIFADDKISQLAHGKYKLDTFNNQIEIVSADQMIEACASVGMPINYNHWSFGKQYIEMKNAYKAGRTGLAYEIVINSDPCISYLMEQNNMAMQSLVIAHACYGHNSFFKGNYLFKEWTEPKLIVEYMSYARKFISECEENYGEKKVEILLDRCHSISGNSIDKYNKPKQLNVQEEQKILMQAKEDFIKDQNVLWKTIPKKKNKDSESDIKEDIFPEIPEENILRFISVYSPKL